MFKLHSEYKPTGDQPQAIEYLSKGIQEDKKFQTLLGVTGSRKNFYNGKYYRASSEANTRFSTQQNTSWTTIFRVQRVLSREQCGILCFILWLLSTWKLYC